MAEHTNNAHKSPLWLKSKCSYARDLICESWAYAESIFFPCLDLKLYHLEVLCGQDTVSRSGPQAL